MGNKLINRSATKAFILAEVKRRRPGWDCTRVSPKVLNHLEAKLEWYIGGIVQHHPTIKHTFTEII